LLAALLFESFCLFSLLGTYDGLAKDRRCAIFIPACKKIFVRSLKE